MLSQKQAVKAGLHLEVDVVADQDVSLHEVAFVLAVLSDHGEGVVHGGA